MIKPEERVVGIHISSWLIRSTSGPWDFQLVCDMGAVLWDWTFNLWGLCYLWTINDRIELNCWTTSWCWRINWYVDKWHVFGVRMKPHTSYCCLSLKIFDSFVDLFVEIVSFGFLRSRVSSRYCFNKCIQSEFLPNFCLDVCYKFWHVIKLLSSILSNFSNFLFHIGV